MPIPAKGSFQFKLAGGKAAQNVLRREWPRSKPHRYKAQNSPAQEREPGCRPKSVAQGKKHPKAEKKEDRHESKGENSLREVGRGERNLPAEQNAARKCGGKRYGRKSHVTLRSFTSVSM